MSRTPGSNDPLSEAQAIAALDAIMPDAARTVCARLSQAGHQAFAVGGAVRDAILGRTPGDWDVATSAEPDQVMALFERTIPTGLAHGTVTVLVGRGEERLPIEVTTFRGDGAYTDGRRPDSVVFGVPLREDLARRDFVLNAMAYDPIARKLADPFGGREDIQARRVRAVGVPRERFFEDGLRVMRAVRFAAVLDFDLDPETQAAIPDALPVLARVSRERVREELMRTLRAERPSRGLDIAWRTGIVHAILPEMAHATTPADHILARVDAVAPDPPDTQPDPDHQARALIRLAALLVDIAHTLPRAQRPEHPLRRLKLSNQDIARVDRLLRARLIDDRPMRPDLELRRFLGAFGRTHVPDLVQLWRADARVRPHMAERISTELARIHTIVERGDALVARDLALTGGDLMEALDLPPGPQLGALLGQLLERVLADPALNTRDALLDLARDLIA